MEREHTFIFPLSEIRRGIEQRTSMIGKMRGSEAAPHLLDRMSLTDGEDFLREDYIQDAARATYDWIRAFGRHREHSLAVFGTMKEIALKEYDGAMLIYPAQSGQEVHLALTEEQYTAAYSHQLMGYVFAIRTNGLVIQTGDAEKIEVEITVGYTMRDDMFVSEYEHTISKEFTHMQSYMSHEGVIRRTTFGSELVSIDSITIRIVDIVYSTVDVPKGGYLVRKYQDGGKTYGVALERKEGVCFTNLPRCVWYDHSVSDSIVYQLDIPDWVDENMLSKVWIDLREALLYYVIWRWFEIVNPKEAEYYYARWEGKAHDAQIGLNTEKNSLQRTAIWL